MFDLKEYLQRQREIINKALSNSILRFCPSDILIKPIQYVLLANGKRLRPILCLAANSIVGGDISNAMPAACALEMIHTYSLVHDDLPALDNDSLRRGRPTCHVQFSESTAILTGDALLTMAFEVLSEAGLQAPVAIANNYLKAIQIISKSAGCRGMIEGQVLDLAYEGIKIQQTELQHLHTLKTGALIRASVEAGAIIGGGSKEQISHLIDYADSIGLAFQVVDDILNVTGTPEHIGKAVGTDAARKKNTYPALLGLDAAKHYAFSLIDRALHALSFFDTDTEPLRAIGHYIIERHR
jgi:geranylgeranyl diphosphate synthase type II